ncbi:MAG: lipid-A-disaccharide synthase [Rhizobium sp. 63-7]|nr:MAG: lipid-A-disaccharide synthase [Rhizobium sp. 63-7]
MVLKVAVIAGEVSGDLLGGDLLAALKKLTPEEIEIVGVGGDAMEAQGLESLFDFSELSIMGLTQVLARLPGLIRRIGETAEAIVEAKPDVLILIDSPDFTHRVAKKVRQALPDLPVVNYVCPSVWAWKEYRATKMLGYVDHVLALLPFEPGVMERLGGPATRFVGHRLTADEDLLRVRQARAARAVPSPGDGRTVLLLPGSRGGEIRSLLPVFKQTIELLTERNNDLHFLLPTVPHQEPLVRELTVEWAVQPEILVGAADKWRAFAVADAALAASGTVVLELALAGVPVVSVYKLDWLMRLMTRRIKTWSAALPNLVADYPVVPEYVDHTIRHGRLARWIERLSTQTPERQAMSQGFERVWNRLHTARSPGEESARIVLRLLEEKGRA